MSSAPIWLVELHRYTDVATSTVSRLSTREYWTQGSDTPANTGYDNRVLDPGNFRRRLFAEGASGARANPRMDVGVGEVTVGAIDGLIDDEFDATSASFRERPIIIRRVDPDAAYSTSVVAINALVSQFRRTRELLGIGIKDRSYELDSPHLTSTFAGDNALPVGLEGGAEMAGRVKPRLYGKCFQVEPPCVNTSRLVYFVSDQALQSIIAAYDGAVQLTAGVARTLAEVSAGANSFAFTVDAGTNVVTTGASHGLATGEAVTLTTSGGLPAPLGTIGYYFARVLSAATVTLHPTAADASANTNVVDITTSGSGTHTLWSNTTAAGYYDWCFDAAGSYARLGLKPTYRFTLDATGHTAANSTTAQLLKRLAMDRDVSSADISAADVSALDGLSTAVCGVYVTTETTREVMDLVAPSAGASYGFDQLGVLRMRQFSTPGTAGVAVVGLTEYDSLEQVENGEDVPTLDVRVEYARYYTVQSAGEISSAATAEQQADLAQPYRVAQYTGTISPNPHKRTLTATRRTALAAKADADVEAERLYGLTNVPRRTFVARGVLLDDASLDALDLGVTVEVRGDRYGLDEVDGTMMTVTEIVYYLRDRECDLRLWC